MLKKKIITLIYIFAIVAITLFVPLRTQHSISKQNLADKTTIMASKFDNDAFYYLTIAKNYSKYGFTTYDQENKTNGYQFLWQTILNYSFSDRKTAESQIEFTWWLCLILLTITNAFIFLAIKKLTGSDILSLLSIFPGYFYLIFDRIIGVHYSPWAAVNGMESSLSILFFSILLIMFVYQSKEKTGIVFLIIISIILSLLFLSRLDEIFLFAGLLIAMIIVSQKEKKFRDLIIISVIPIVVIIAYIVFNLINYGLILPVSGLIKSGFYPANLIHLINSLYTGRSFDFLAGEHLYSRVLPLVIPLLTVIFLSVSILKSRIVAENRNFKLLISGMKYYVILKALYMLFFVDFWNQGFWYFFIPVIVMNIFIALWLRILFAERINSRIFLFSGIIVLLFLLNGYYLLEEEQTKQKVLSYKLDLQSIRDSVYNAIGKQPLLEIDDGIIAYSTDNKCMSGTGLCLDKQSYQSFVSGQLLELAMKRGYSYIASLNYFKRAELIPDSSTSLSDFFAVNTNQQFAIESHKYLFKRILTDKKTGLVILKFSKK